MTPEYPILPLDFWREEMGYNPWHFWGLADATIVPVTSKCNMIVKEYSWQDTDALGREDIRRAIVTAEKILFDHLAYWVAPVYSVKTLPWPKYQDRRLSRLGRHDATGRWIPIQLEEGHVRDCGIETLTVIQAGQAITYSDLDGDGIAESWSTGAVATTVTDIKQIAVYVPSADRNPVADPLAAKWRIEPVKVSISGGNVTITGKRWLMASPTLYGAADLKAIDPTVASNFLDSVDIYRRYTYTEGDDSGVDSQSALIWESHPCTWGCKSTNSSTDPYSEGWVAGRCGIRDSEAGIVIPAEAVYNAVTGIWSHPNECLNCCGEPDKVLIRYLAGMALDANAQMQKSFRTLVSRLSAAEMTRRICACDTANREWSNWQFDISRVNGPEIYQANLDIFNNPLGTRRGHIYAWQQIKQLARVVGTIA